MSTPDYLQAQVEQIFVDGEINNEQLKEFLKLISSRVSPLVETIADTEAAEGEEEEKVTLFDGCAQVNYLNELIAMCEKRLADIPDAPRTKVFIRNEGEKLQSIIDQLDCVRCQNCDLQNEVRRLVESHEKLKKLECEKKQKYQDMIDRLYRESMSSDVCKLRTMFYFLQNRVEELQVKAKSMQESIDTIFNKILAIELIPVLEGKVNMLLDWRASLREEFELFVEKYEHVKTVKAGKCEVKDWLECKVDYGHLSKYVHKVAFDSAKEDFIKEFDELKELFYQFQLSLTMRLVALDKNVQMALSQLASKRRIEKR